MSDNGTAEVGQHRTAAKQTGGDEGASGTVGSGAVVQYHPVTDDLLLTQDPDRYLLSAQTGDEYNGLPVYADGPPSFVPCETIFISPGGDSNEVDTLDELCRALRDDYFSPWAKGDAGTGKNTSIDAVGHKLGQPVYRLQCSSDMTGRDAFASTELRDGYTVTTLRAWGLAAVFGGIAVVDEINRAAGSPVMKDLLAMCEARGKRRVPVPGTGVVLSDLPDDKEWDSDRHLGRYLHPQFRAVATGNPPTYKGAGKINSALNDRFTPIEYDYADVETEAEILSDKAECDADGVEPLVRVIHNEIRLPRQNNAGVTCPVSFRRLHDAVNYALDHDTTLYQAAVTKIAGYAQTEANAQQIRGALNDHKRELSIKVSDAGSLSLYCSVGVWDDTNGVDEIASKYHVCPDCDLPYVEEAGRSDWETDFRSSNIARYRWVGPAADIAMEEGEVEIAFYGESGGEPDRISTYRYEGVKYETYKRLGRSDSKGQFFQNNMRGEYDCEKLAEGDVSFRPKTIVDN